MTPHPQSYRALDLDGADFPDDAATIVTDRRELFHDPAPPALPFALRRRTVDEQAWLESLPPETRAVLESAREPVADWPRVSRPLGAIALPLHKIPSLRRAH
jgi:hypothetical protein